jgi:serine protease Do
MTPLLYAKEFCHEDAKKGLWKMADNDFTPTNPEKSTETNSSHNPAYSPNEAGEAPTEPVIHMHAEQVGSGTPFEESWSQRPPVQNSGTIPNEPIRTMGSATVKRSKGRGLTAIVVIIAIIFAVGILGLAGTGVYYLYLLYSGGTTQTIANRPDGQPSIVSEQQEIAPSQQPDNLTIESPSKAGVLSTPDIVKRVRPSVVAVQSEFARYGVPEMSSGSGVIMSEDGYIVTNAHIIEGGTNVKVILSDGVATYGAAVVGVDTQTDIAVLKVEAKGLQAAVFGDSDLIQDGDRVVATGSPYGMELAGITTQGIISGFNRDIEINGRKTTLLQTDATINSGNSGGPLINDYGQVIGITSTTVSAFSHEGIGFAIPINSAKAILDDLMNTGSVQGKPFIGIVGEGIDEFQARVYAIPQGITVVSVMQGSAAENAGILQGDIVIKFNGKIVKTIEELNGEKDACKVGETITVTVYRNGQVLDLPLVLTEQRPDSE